MKEFKDDLLVLNFICILEWIHCKNKLALSWLVWSRPKDNANGKDSKGATPSQVPAGWAVWHARVSCWERYLCNGHACPVPLHSVTHLSLLTLSAQLHQTHISLTVFCLSLGWISLYMYTNPVGEWNEEMTARLVDILDLFFIETILLFIHLINCL